MIEHGFLGVKYSKSYDWLHDKYRQQVQNQYQQMKMSEEYTVDDVTSRRDTLNVENSP